ncbi:MAG: hypothetical protein ACTHVE_09690, partial [Senegalia sp. (in: firmicutes)]|uniref:hypothetical protein n=1 Tax=Senegalia sp. (in: firmicutes) TaxID=1924098 RepID=UPI003F945E60
MNANTFNTIKEFHSYIEKNFKIIPSEWKRISLINSAEGEVEGFFDGCKTTGQLVDKLLIPVVEEALSINNTNDFVSSFEKQREHFKKHKQLRNKIEESQAIEEQINKYVKIYTDLYEVEKDLDSEFEKAKSLYNYTLKEEEINESHLVECIENKDQLEESKDKLTQKILSHEIHLSDEIFKKLKKTYDNIRENYENIKNQYDVKGEELQNLKIAEIKSDLKSTREKIEFYKEKIENLDNDTDIEEIKESFKRNSGNIKFYFENIIYDMKKKLELISSQNKKYLSELSEQEKELENIENKDRNYREKLAEIKATINLLKKDTKKIESNILANPLNESIEIELPKWVSRTKDIESEILEYQNNIRKSQNEKKKLSNDFSELLKEIDITKTEYIKHENYFDIMGEEQEDIISQLNIFGIHWQSLNNLYKRESSILETIEETVEKHRKEKEDFIIKERIASRFIDQYEENEYFSAEPNLEKWIGELENQFKFLESGTKYIEKTASKLKKTIEECLKDYPFWSLTIITTKEEEQKLLHKINSKNDDLTYPVIILNIEDANDIIKNGNNDLENIIIPKYWIDNSNTQNFIKWKNKLSTIFEDLKMKRQDKEKELLSWTELLRKARNFYEKYPYEIIVEKQKEKREFTEKINELNRDISINKDRLNQIDSNLQIYNEKIKDLDGENGVIGNNILQGNIYIDKKDKIEEYINHRAETQNQVDELKEDIKLWSNKIKIIKDILDENESVKSEMNNQLYYTQNNDLYIEVKDMPLESSKTSIETLKEERESIKNELNNQQKDRISIEENLNRELNNIRKLEKRLEQEKKESIYPIDEDIIFTSFSNRMKDSLIDSRNILKEKLDEIKPVLYESENEMKDEKRKYDLLVENFNKKYVSVIEFDKSLNEIEKDIILENKVLKEKEENLNIREDVLNKERENIKKAKNILDKNDGKYSYLNKNIKVTSLSKEIKQDYPYNREKIIEVQLDNLNKVNDKLNILKEKVDKQINIFIRFCEENVVDIKLRTMAVSGIRTKKEYKDILKWQESMKDRISRIIKFAEDDLREHDKELQQFINHLYSHLLSVCEELRYIPKKTKVKVDDRWKDIFIFTIPTWDEYEGKKELRNHIDWMIKELEGDNYKDEEDNEDESQVRKSIEKWLDTKQLLQNIMKDDNIKVKCRKVTNDRKVSSIPISWEQSNKWSGGEKWSKNTTLFLGILNYLAEKSQHISSNKKRHRTVLMDNPFGKASSDHVLDPVFFIAEQLGFQIIALTAHTEG